MGWLKHVVIDLAVTLVIVVAVVTGQAWAQWIVWIYTPFMLFLKLGALFGGSLTAQIQQPDVPAWFFHVLYAFNVAVLLFYGWWLGGTGWALIWALSAAAERRPATPAKKG